MKKASLRLKSSFLLFWLSVIAFITGCGSNGNQKKNGNNNLINDEPATEYGCPSADYIINIHVNDEDGKVIEGIEVVVSESDTIEESLITEYTDTTGLARFEIMDFPEDSKKYYLKISDIDNESNGFYSSLDTSVVFDYSEFTGKDENDRWYAGVAEKNLEIILRKDKK